MKHRGVWILGTLALILIGITVAFLWVRAVESRRWAHFEAILAETIAEADARDFRRPVLRGEPVPGRAWEDYLAAAAALRATTADLDQIHRHMKKLPFADRGKLDVILAADAPALALLRAGARREIGALPRDDGNKRCRFPGVERPMAIARVGFCQARVWAEAGKVRDAAELLVDLAFYGRDFADVTLMSTYGLTLSLEALEELARLLPAELPGVEGQLSRLEESLPGARESLLGDAVVIGRFIQMSKDEPAASWRTGFSRKISLANEFDEMLARIHRQVEADAMPWASAREVDFHWIRGGPMFAFWVRQRRDWKARIRLLRAALRGPGAPPLGDPFGDTLRSDEARIWSVGQDGVDGGGVGSWKVQDAGDIVLELKKK